MLIYTIISLPTNCEVYFLWLFSNLKKKVPIWGFRTILQKNGGPPKKFEHLVEFVGEVYFECIETYHVLLQVLIAGKFFYRTLGVSGVI